ncbi:hypothetical protein A2154_01395 [Candidatus Gottesmanbacteria bacterium RBG_16_43_7]|uniref:EamA domain-containing protein n=1 Tax=Candidatus Gottesmanbacteria bacterium RBG_16_43_7 TaxID=1798373 RepID=A0A1F5ZB86_9BACT|nr:MAG: hypothetical protein A2154_01395 [Candidatus Gottesmanbacteria bacterium RBG_16_43_7]
MNWLPYALLSAFFAALTAILAKVGVSGINSNLATAIRTIFILLFAWGIVFFQGTHKQLPNIPGNTMLFLFLSVVATGLSWLFYFRALQIGTASQVAPVDKLSLVLTVILAAILLREKVTLSIIIGSILMTAGALMIALGK